MARFFSYLNASAPESPWAILSIQDPFAAKNSCLDESYLGLST